MAEITASTTSKRKGFLKKSHSHRSTRVDLTPMVDLGFLLITFFVFTTSLSQAKAMELTEIHDGPPKPVKNSATMTIILSKDRRIYYYNGSRGQENTAITQTDLAGIRSLIVNKKKNTDPDFLMYIIKADSVSTFGDCIDLLDEMTICGIKPGHYAEMDITKEEIDLIKKRN